ncbi:MAG: valine--tRNA ligase [Candidatus Limnocylindrales bacterium]
MTERETDGLPKAYVPAAFETAIYERWLAADVFAPDGAGSRADSSKPPYVIVQPPPNVTGALHIGHALTADIEDVMIRRARMLRRPTLWLPGLDHAGIGAQVVFERLIAAEGETRESLGRERYLERMEAFVATTRETILRQSRRFGSSLDWSRTRFTMDEVSSKAVRTAFTRLYGDGLAYRTEALVNWCPGCRTSVSDLEVIPTPETGTLWTVRYHLLDPEGGSSDASIAVATTRPETILGDVAVAVHPDDPRYRELVGRIAVIPFVDRPVPVIADPVVQPEFGTGAVKITPAHDPDDYATGQRHGLPMITVLDDDARMNAAAGPYAGLDRYAARARIVADLEARGDLLAAKPHEMLIGRCQRSDDVIEPLLKTQWFIRTAPLAARALDATRTGRTRILPGRFVKVWEHWLTEIRDWNVSRQLWWGHRIPAWYCPDGHVTVTADPAGPADCQVCGRPTADLVQDPDIFDTWFSSGLWPFSTLGWPTETPDLLRFYPGSVMETAYDIIFFWVARMMMLGIHLMGEVPFETVYLSGLVRDPYGKKMSKTTGNVVDPLEAIDEIGADALRFALINGTAPGNDLRLGREKLENARNFTNKLWNAARFVLGARPSSVLAGAALKLPDETRLAPADRWIRSRAAATVKAVDSAMADFAFGEACRLLYDAIWSEYCDWGLEFAKVRLAPGAATDEEQAATWWTLVEVLDTYLRLLHPVMPFVTEAIWGRLPRRAGDPGLLVTARWPVAGSADEQAEARVGALIELVRGIRNARAEAKVDPAAWLPTNAFVPPLFGPTFEELRPALERLARARPLERRLAPEDLHAAAGEGALAVLVGDLEAAVRPGVVDAAAAAGERARLERELTEAERLLAAARVRLANAAFIAKAPPPVVAGARAREAELAEQVARLGERLGR